MIANAYRNAAASRKHSPEVKPRLLLTMVRHATPVIASMAESCVFLVGRHLAMIHSISGTMIIARFSINEAVDAFVVLSPVCSQARTK